MIELSILVATVSARRGLLSRLLAVLEPQLNADAEVIVHQGERKTMGRKFSDLYAAANGRLSVQVDDDDLVASDFVEQILSTSPGHDFVGYKIYVTVDGGDKGMYQTYEIDPIRAKTLKPYDPRDLVRHVTPKCPLETLRAQRFPFPNGFGADYFWTEDLVRDGYPFNPVFIPKVLYYYDSWVNHSLGTRPSEWTEQRQLPVQDYDRHAFTWIGRP
jgi:hypothetical protein